MSDGLDLMSLRKLKAMIGGDPEDLAELVDDFIATLPDQLAQMRIHGGKGDWVSLRIAAHGCKSNSRDLGALSLSQLCGELEAECLVGEVQGLANQLSRISEAVETALAQFDVLDLKDV